MCNVTTLTIGEGAFLEGLKKGEDQVLIDSRAVIYAPDNGRYCPISDFHLMQYTGLKDHKENKIYEGDIVDCCRYENNEIYTVEIIDLRKLPKELFGSDLNWREVVGNIYEPTKP